MAATKKATAKDERLPLRIRADLKKDIKEYAKRNSTSPSELVTRFFEGLLKRDEEERQKTAKKKFF
jgi:hypothetical protein